MSETPIKRARTISVKECRACLTNIDDGTCCVDIFRAWDPSWPGMGVSIAEDLAKLSNIQINFSDPYSKSICTKCCSRLQDAIDFTQSVQNNDIVLRKRHNDRNEKPEWPKPIQVDKNIASNALTEMAVEVKQEILTEDEYEMNESCSDTIESKLDIKIEPEEITPASTSVVIEVTGLTSLPQPVEKKTVTNGATQFNDECLVGDVKEEPMSEDEAEPSADMPKDCMLCFKTFNTVKGLKAHVIAVHSYASVTSPRVDRANVCSTCNRSFATRTDLFVHETCHSKFACYVCDKKFDTFHLLTKHRSKQCMQTSTMPRLKTLEDVRRPDPVYYVSGKKVPPSKSLHRTVNATPEPSINSSSQNTVKIEPYPSLVRTNPVLEQSGLGNNIKKQDVQSIETATNEQTSVYEKSNSGVQEILSDWNEIPEQIQLQGSTEKVSEKSTINETLNQITEETQQKPSIKVPEKAEKTNSSPNKGSGVNQLSDDNKQVTNESKIIEPLASKTEVHQSETIKSQENTHNQDSIDKDIDMLENIDDTAVMADSESCKKAEVQKSLTSHCNNESVESQSSNDTKYESEVSDKTKENVSEVRHEVDEKRSDVINIMEDNKSEVSSITKVNVQEEPTAFETAANENSLKFEANNVEENIELQSLDTCANDKTEKKAEQIDAAEFKQNETIENFEPLLPKQLECLKASPSGDSMEIQLEIHSMDKEDNAMDIDHDLDVEIKNCSGSDKGKQHNH